MRKLLLLLVFGIIFLSSLASAITYTQSTDLAQTNTAGEVAAIGRGANFTANSNITLLIVTLYPGSAASSIGIYYNNKTGIVNASVVSKNATFNLPLLKGQGYYICQISETTSGWATGASYPYNRDYVNFTSGGINCGNDYSVETTLVREIRSITIEPIASNDVNYVINNTYPVNGSNFIESSRYLNATYNITTLNANWTNTTYTIWWPNATLFNSTTRIITGMENSSTQLFINLPFVSPFTWNVVACHNNGTIANCTLPSANSTFNIKGFKFNSQSFNTPTTETLTEKFYANITLASGVSLNNASLIWNGTTYGGTTNTTGSDKILSRSLVIPNVTATTNVSLVWNIYYTYANGTLVTENITIATNQTINTLAIDNCVVNTQVILNYTINDEDARTFLVNSTWNTSSNVYVKLSGDFSGVNYEYYSANIVKNPIAICINNALVTGQNYRLDSTIQYTASDYVTEYHYIENSTLNTSVSPKNVSLYLLSVNRSQEFLITFKDGNLIPVEGALIELSRQYLSLGQFLSVEISKTDNDGKTIGHFVLNDEVYTIYVKKNGVLLATYENVRAFCSDIVTGDCRINLNQVGSTANPSSFSNYLGVIGTEAYNDTSKVYTFTFTTSDSSSKTINVTMLKYDNFLNQTICSSALTSSSGTITCTIPAAYYNSTALVTIYVNGVEYSSHTFDITISKAALLGASRFLLAFFLIITIPLLAFTSGPMTLIFFVVGLVAAGGLALIDWGGFIGPFSAFLWFVVAAIILLIKASSRRQQ